MLYIHIPFCNSKCFYCAFNSYTNKNDLKDAYFEALKLQFKTEIKPNKFDSIFIGGGTPSVMSIKFYEKLFKMLNPYIATNTEITIEANPNSTKKEWLREIRNFGVNRISFGVQSFDENKLKFLGRNHTKNGAITSIENSKKFFDNINIDIIYSTMLDTKKILKNDLDMAISLGVNHISAYSLTIEKGTKFYNYPQAKQNNEYLEVWFVNMIKSRFYQYEISNFGKICKHNLGYWKLKNYIGIGAGAVSFVDNKRYYTHSLIENYIQNPTYKKIEKLSPYEIKEEIILLGLRSIVGFDKTILNQDELDRAYQLIDDKLILKDDKFYSKEFLLADAISLWILG
jgi:oxygen-independent coproporphyrinogen-3 oxidase